MLNFNNKWINGAVPALLIHSCIGSVYCWSLLKGDIASSMNVDVANIEFAFALAIFCLGMSAAFGGRFVEKNVRLSSFISMSFFTFGLILSCFSIHIKNEFMLFVSYGLIMGIGLGIGYLSPVKTLMLWFKEHKGMATGIAISGFGLSKAMFSPFIQWCNTNYGVMNTLFSMSVISFFLMTIASYLIKKPEGWVENNDRFSIKEALSIIINWTYIKIWLIFFINITCGLVIISFERNISLYSGITPLYIGLVASMSALFNTIGRFGYATLSDRFTNKERIYEIIFMTSILATIGYNMLPSFSVVMVLILLAFVNLGYGGGFSTLPILLSSKFGMEKISTIHGFCLSAWAFASLAAFLITQVFVYMLVLDFNILINILIGLYVIAFIISISLKDKSK